jgi:uncharacterized protein
MRKKFTVSVIAGLVIALSLISCGGGSNDGGDSSETFREEALSAMTSQVIVTGIQSVQDAAVSLNSAVETFVADPTLDTLSTAQNQWKTLFRKWQLTEAYQFGPVDDTLLGSKIYFWPKDTEDIEGVLNGSDTLDDTFPGTVGATRKGLAVIEYLLFDPNASSSTTLASFEGDNGARKRAYVEVLAQDLVTQTTTLESAWVPSGNNYAGTFLASSMAMRTLFNQVIATIEIGKNTKIGKPLGKSNADTAQPELSEALESQQSLNALAANIEGVEALFDSGMSTYLTVLGFTTLSTSIQTQIDLIYTDINAISSPLSDAVSSETADVNKLYTDLTELLRLIKVDMANAINETVLFNDSDGD